MSLDNINYLIKVKHKNMEQKTKLEWKPKTWKCPKCGTEIGNDYDRCSNCWAGPLPMKEINETINNYYKENGKRSFRNS